MTDGLIEILMVDFRALLAAMANGNIVSLPLLDHFYDGVTITDASWGRTSPTH